MRRFQRKADKKSEQRTFQKIKQELQRLDRIEKRLAEVEKLLTESIEEVERELTKRK
ncbi:MAG TPA: hypothetical protein VJ179_01995 [Patescibacteria group bacterium]|nr:hypothetical protein [Patescibacteria group bacterium]